MAVGRRSTHGLAGLAQGLPLGAESAPETSNKTSPTDHCKTELVWLKPLFCSTARGSGAEALESAPNPQPTQRRAHPEAPRAIG